MRRISDDDWQVVALSEGAETTCIGGLKSKAEVDQWLAEPSRTAWLRSQGYAK